MARHIPLLAVLVCLAAAPVARADLAAGLVGHWSFNGTYQDISGNANHGTPVGGMTFTADRFGNPDGAGLFNGSNSYVLIPSSASLESATPEVTMAAWARRDGPSLVGDGFCPILMKSTSAANSFMYRIYMSGTGSGVAYNNWFTYATHLRTFDVGVWYHLAASFDGSEVKYYVDGVLENTYPLTATIVATTLDLTIGADHPGIQEIFNGALDDVRVYARVLDPGEVALLAGVDPTAVGEGALPAGMVLGAATPNPTASGTALELSLETPVALRVTVHDVTGRRVRELLEGVQPAGRHTLAWDGRDATGRRMPRGTYYLRLETESGAATRPVVLLR